MGAADIIIFVLGFAALYSLFFLCLEIVKTFIEDKEADDDNDTDIFNNNQQNSQR